MPQWFFLLSLLLFGLTFGSFANVVIWRLPRGESLSNPPSHCPSCNQRIEIRDNIPVISWFLLGGRCRTCGEPISERYPIVELLSGALWLAAGVRFGPTLGCAAAVVFFYVLLLLAFIDWDTMRLPNPLTLLLGGGGYAGAVCAAIWGLPILPLTPGTGWLANPLLSAAVGSASGVFFTLGIALAYRFVRRTDGFGVGDMKLLAAMGPFLGPYVLMALFFGSVMGAVYGVTSIRAGKLGLRTKFPFGPFLAIAAVVVVVAGPQIWGWYTGWIRVL